MNKSTYTEEKLGTGAMNVYDFGELRLHAYQTNDPIDNEVFLVEKDGRVVMLESPCFYENNRELEQYLAAHGLKAEGMLLAYHMAGGSFLPGVKRYATKNADEYGHTGGGRALIDNFGKVFGERFDSSIHTVTDYLEEGEVTLAGIRFRITATSDAFDVEIPGLNAVYTHMLGHDCHSIVAGAGHADVLIAQLNSYLQRGYSLVLTSHYTPEDLKDVRTKIGYLENLKKLAETCGNAEAFKTAVKARYKEYSGENYLDMTAGFFFEH